MTGVKEGKEKADRKRPAFSLLVSCPTAKLPARLPIKQQEKYGIG